MFRHRTFRSTLIGANVFRIGAGAVPFLLPLMLQLGFGLTPFQSGVITFVSAGGAIVMKFVVKRVLKAGGFRTILLASSLGAALSIAIMGLFTPQTPVALMMALLFAGGLVRSLFFTSANSLIFGDLDDKDAAQATAISSSAQQVAIAVGVALAGGILDLLAADDGSLSLSAFHTAFFIIAAVTTLAAIPFIGLSRDAGSTVSGHRIDAAGSRAAAPVRSDPEA